MTVVVKFGTLSSNSPVSILHGGAGPADPKGEKALAALAALKNVALKIATAPQVDTLFPYLVAPSVHTLPTRTHPACTAAANTSVYAASLLELEPCFNAGLGSALQADGAIRVSAAFMESSAQKFSAVLNATDVLHPSTLAFALQSERFCVLDGQGTQNLARDLGVPRTDLLTRDRLDRWVKLKLESFEDSVKADGKGTIGCVSFDSLQNLAAVTSTGGVGNETVGRVGDTPTVAGTYCTAKVGVSCTGYGEQILNTAFAARLATRVEDGASLQHAMQQSLAEADARGYEFAAIAVAYDAQKGEVQWAAGTTETYFIWAVVLPTGVLSFADA